MRLLILWRERAWANWQIAAKWLRNNKVFFETVAASLLAVASIVVAIVQTQIAADQGEIFKETNLSDRQTNSFIDLQTRVAEAQAMPSFDIRIAQQPNPESGTANDNSLTIDNNGGPVHGFEAEAILTLRVTAAASNDPPLRRADVRFLVENYYTASVISASSRGRLTTMIGKDNNRTMNDFSIALRAWAVARHWWYADDEESTFLQLIYNDILNRPHLEYYAVDPVSGGLRLSDDEGARSLTKPKTI